MAYLHANGVKCGVLPWQPGGMVTAIKELLIYQKILVAILINYINNYLLATTIRS